MRSFKLLMHTLAPLMLLALHGFSMRFSVSTKVDNIMVWHGKARLVAIQIVARHRGQRVLEFCYSSMQPAVAET